MGHLDRLADLLRDHDVAFALLFGSRARGDEVDGSDTDVAVMPTEGTDVYALRGALGEGVDVVDLPRAPEYLAGRISLEGTVLVDTDPVARVRWQADTRKRHLDERFRREQFRRDFVRAHGRPPGWQNGRPP